MRTHDGANSTAPAVQAQIERLEALSAGADGLGLDRVARLLARLGHPERRLPPVFHVAGTNGKGSTCAFLRSALEADGRSVHVYTSPHLVRFNERIRVGGALITDDLLADVLEEVLDVSRDIGPSFFEATTAAALLAFSRSPADACIIEVGLGGRLDATNIIPAPAITAIAQLGLDHQDFLGNDASAIAREKAGIAKPGIPLVTMAYPMPVAHAVAATAMVAGARLLPLGTAWTAAVRDDRIAYVDGWGGLSLALPTLAGPHQPMNAALATAMLRHQTAVPISPQALQCGPAMTRWPARLQRLEHGRLHRRIGAGISEIWLDGGHNPDAAHALTRHFAALSGPRPRTAMILGMLATKDAIGFLSAVSTVVDVLHVVPVTGQISQDPVALARYAANCGMEAVAHPTLGSAFDALVRSGEARRLIIAGSLHLAGEVLRANGEVPI